MESLAWGDMASELQSQEVGPVLQGPRLLLTLLQYRSEAGEDPALENVRTGQATK